jgi:apoptosis-inducing factor 3
MELVQAVSKRKLASINVIGMEEFPFEMVLGKEVGKGLKKVRASPPLVVRCDVRTQIVKLVSRVARCKIPYANGRREDYCFI